ncbi:MAG: hypothetical protein R3B70_22645 [Polyangiaceae bacterium]
MTAARKLYADEEDPVLAAFRDAPLSDEPETEEERAADRAAIAEYQAGRARTLGRDAMRATLERMRHEQGE